MNLDLDYRYLKAFYLTAKHMSFSQAAKDLSIAQSAVSRQVKLLEESLKTQLIIRSSKKVLLTTKGTSLYNSISQFEESTFELTEKIEEQTIRVGILHGLLENWFIPIIKEFTQVTNHRLNVYTDYPWSLKQDLVDGKVDMIFSTENIQNDLITSKKLFEEKLAIISKDEIDIKKVYQYPWITYSEFDFFYDLYKKRSSKIMTIKSMTAIIKLVQNSVGIAIVPMHTIKDIQDLQIYPIKNNKRPQIHMSTLNYQKLPGHLRQLSELVDKYI